MSICLPNPNLPIGYGITAYDRGGFYFIDYTPLVVRFSSHPFSPREAEAALFPESGAPAPRY